MESTTVTYDAAGPICSTQQNHAYLRASVPAASGGQPRLERMRPVGVTPLPFPAGSLRPGAPV